MNGNDIKPGEVVHSRDMTTHYLGGGVYITVRRAWGTGWLVEWRNGFGFHYLTGEPVATRAEADEIALLEALVTPLYAGGVA